MNDLLPWILGIAALGGTVIAFLRWKSQGIFINPSVLTDIQKMNTQLQTRSAALSRRLDEETKARRALGKRANQLEQDKDKLSDRLDAEITSRRKLQAISQDARDRIKSLEQNDIMNQKSLAEMRKTLEDWQQGIEILITQIESHDSRPNWTPKGYNKDE